MDSTDLPTPEQVAAYLEARGWAELAGHPRYRSWRKGADVVCLDMLRHPEPAESETGCLFLLAELARIEGRPTPAEQVRRDMLRPKQSQRGAAKRQADLRDEVVRCAQAWDDAPGDLDLCVALSDACRDERQGPLPWGVFRKAVRDE